MNSDAGRNGSDPHAIWDGEFDPPTLALTLRMGRYVQDMSGRALARRAGLSPAQISRIESGQITHPTVETVVALARALNFNPVLMLIVSGHLPTAQARAWLESFATEQVDDAESNEVRGWVRRDLFQGPDSDTTLRGIAMQLLSAPVRDVDYDEAALQAVALIATQSPQDEALEEIREHWGSISPERRERILHFVRDQRTLSPGKRGG